MTESKRRKETPMFSGFVCYFPDAMAEVARLPPLAREAAIGSAIVYHQIRFDQSSEIEGISSYHAAYVAQAALLQLQLLVETSRAPDPEEWVSQDLFRAFVRPYRDAMAEVARLSLAGNLKHNPGEPLHHARGKSTDHGDCIVRHQAEYDRIDAEDGFYHAVKVAWRSMAQLQELLERVRGLPLARGARAAEPVKAPAGAGLRRCQRPDHGCLTLTSHPTGLCTVCWRLGWPTKA